jgi:hypothetical protein
MINIEIIFYKQNLNGNKKNSETILYRLFHYFILLLGIYLKSPKTSFDTERGQLQTR